MRPSRRLPEAARTLSARLGSAHHEDDRRGPRRPGPRGFISCYSTAETDDGLPGTEGQFLACSFWLVNALAVDGRLDEARELFERVLGLTNDLGLLAEEYYVSRQRHVGSFAQAFSHVALDQRRGHHERRGVSSDRRGARLGAPSMHERL